MSEEEINILSHELAMLEAINRLISEYKNIRLTKEQIYSLYQECAPENYIDIIGNGVKEELP